MSVDNICENKLRKVPQIAKFVKIKSKMICFLDFKILFALAHLRKLVFVKSRKNSLSKISLFEN